MSSPHAVATTSFRRSTWVWVIVLVLAGYYLESECQQMHLSKVLFFASFGVWARDMRGPRRWVQLGLAAALCLSVLVTWYYFRGQHLVPLGHGVYRLVQQ